MDVADQNVVPLMRAASKRRRTRLRRFLREPADRCEAERLVLVQERWFDNCVFI
ncbi:hypothetical protein RRSWK_06388 [Rhodopirellula sp. SWK7]|nr:hypothetical protein RRSWK_06388 [Rhodopirellula sp. SWK7]